MSNTVILGLLVIIGHFGVQSLTTTISQRVVVGGKKFKCNFQLVYSPTTVNVKRSTVKCSPTKPRMKNAKVELESDGFIFIGKININPTKIVSMTVDSKTTTLTPTTATRSTFSQTTVVETTMPTGTQATTVKPNHTSGVEEVEFKALYNNVSSDLRAEDSHMCGIDFLEQNMKKMDKSYTNMAPDQFWDNAVVPWSFVSTGDDFATYGVHTDANVGLTKEDVWTVMAAMKQIEAKTCIKFNLVKPVKGQPWLFILRDARASDMTCMISYMRSNLVGKDVAGLGDIYRRLGFVSSCLGGAYAWYGSSSPQNFVISQTKLEHNNQNSIGLVVHELLHNLGLGHTQKRQDASQHIQINWGNIKTASYGQYEPCITSNDPVCSRYNSYGTPYDCMSIMHYRDWAFITPAARASGGKTMVPRRTGCDLSTNARVLSNTDISILKKMYCANRPQEKAVMSTNYPENYPNNEDKEFPISVADGYVVRLLFTEFKIESHASCDYDWVQVVDADGTMLLDKYCGNTKPDRITSRTKSITVKFHSDQNENFAGFHAEYEPVKPTSPPVDGGWSDWSGWGTCINGKDGKSVCKKKKVRYCNKPAATNGGRPCAGESDMYEDCVPEWTNPTKNPDCVLTGGWSVWSSATTCSTLCTSERTRTCTNPMSINSKECEGPASELSSCTGGNCPSTTSGTLKSTNFPSNYPDKDDLTFPLVVEAGSTITLTFTDFDLEAESSCGYDYVKVLDTDGTTQLAKVCGDSIPSPINSSGNKITVVFHSDESVNKKGFEATWKKVAGVSSGVVTSPGYPSSYPNSQSQVKTISVPQGEKIKLTFTAFNIEVCNDAGLFCLCDKLTIYDSATQSGNKLGELCGESLSSVTDAIVSTGNAMTLVFTSDGSVVFTGFHATWIQI